MPAADFDPEIHNSLRSHIRYREEDLERILSDEGILLRINRNIQAEGSFGEPKQSVK